jgi:hypothetical protein
VHTLAELLRGKVILPLWHHRQTLSDCHFPGPRRRSLAFASSPLLYLI